VGGILQWHAMALHCSLRSAVGAGTSTTHASCGIESARCSLQQLPVATWHLPAARTSAATSLSRPAHSSAVQSDRSSTVKAAGLRRANPDSLFQLPAGKADRSAAQECQQDDGSATSKPTASRQQLDKLFDILRKETKIVAAQNFSCCQSCGTSQIRRHMYLGYASGTFFHVSALIDCRMTTDPQVQHFD
jgi:hypothetical protein